MAINFKKRPVLTDVVKVWSFNSGTRIMVGMDYRGDVWIVESCPAGNWAWKPSEIRHVKNGSNSARMYAEPLKLAEKLQGMASEVDRQQYHSADYAVCTVG